VRVQPGAVQYGRKNTEQPPPTCHHCSSVGPHLHCLLVLKHSNIQTLSLLGLETRFHTHKSNRQSYSFAILMITFWMQDGKNKGSELNRSKHFQNWIWFLFPVSILSQGLYIYFILVHLIWKMFNILAPISQRRTPAPHDGMLSTTTDSMEGSSARTPSRYSSKRWSKSRHPRSITCCVPYVKYSIYQHSQLQLFRWCMECFVAGTICDITPHNRFITDSHRTHFIAWNSALWP
jgi:hypothetical protein